MHKRTKWIGCMILLVLMGSYFFYEWMKPIPVSRFVVQMGGVIVHINEEGTVMDFYEKDIYPMLPNEIVLLSVEEGQEIIAGQHIASLDVGELTNQIHRLQEEKAMQHRLLNEHMVNLNQQIENQILQIEKVSQLLVMAKKELSRMEASIPVDRVGTENARKRVIQLENELEQHQLLWAELEAGIKPDDETVSLIEKEIMTLETQLLKWLTQQRLGEIIAPIDGIVKNIRYRQGAVANSQIPICTIHDPNRKHIKVFIEAEQAEKMHIGMDVEFYIPKDPERDAFLGTIDFIASTSVEWRSSKGESERRVLIRILAADGKEIELPPGSIVQVRFTTFREDNRITIPKASVFMVNGKDAVWRINENSAQITYIDIERESGAILVIDGLTEGEQIIVNADHKRLKEGRIVSYTQNR